VLRWCSKVRVPFQRRFVRVPADQCVRVPPGLDHGVGARQRAVGVGPLWPARCGSSWWRLLGGVVGGVDLGWHPRRGRGGTVGWGWWPAVAVAWSVHLISARLSCPGRPCSRGPLGPRGGGPLAMGRMVTATAGFGPARAGRPARRRGVQRVWTGSVAATRRAVAAGVAAPVIVSRRGVGRVAVAHELFTCGACKTRSAVPSPAHAHAEISASDLGAVEG
jgi:hypothetical protein